MLDAGLACVFTDGNAAAAFTEFHDDLGQLDDVVDWPLMRTTALQSLPAALRADVVARSNRTALQFTGLMIDGMRDGSLRIVDPLIASQFVIA